MSVEYEQIGIFPSLPKTSRGLPTPLNASPNGDKIVYSNGNSIFLVPTDNFSTAEIYSEHSVQTTVGKFSPSGFYCASGDQNGNVRLWDTTQSSHILKATYQVFAGPVRDIAWSEDSKRLAVVGEGRDRFGHVFLFDTGTSNGNLTGQSRSINSVDIRPARPYRIITGSEDNSVAIFEGPPFKFKTTLHEHNRFVNVTRYNNTGSLFASAGADGKIVIYNGVDATKIGELGDGHTGSVFGLSWSPDGQFIATASGDKTVKIWKVENRTLENTINFGDTLEDQQVGVLWTQKGLFSVSLSGFINFLNPEFGDILETKQGHNKSITALAMSEDKKYLATSDFEGNIVKWELGTGISRRRQPKTHSSQIVGLAYTKNKDLISISWDDTMKITSSRDFGMTIASVKLPSQPLGLAIAENETVAMIACYDHIVMKTDDDLKIHKIDYNPSCIAISDAKRSMIAVGGQDSTLRIYKYNADNKLELLKTLKHAGPITAVAFSPNSEHLVVTDAARKVTPYSTSNDFSKASSKDWTFHTAKVTCVAWSPNGNRIATGSLDTNIIIWDILKNGDDPVIMKGAHANSPINGVIWKDDNTLISAGHDANIKHWKIN